MAKVRLKNPEWATFSSYIGTTKFKNGESEDHVSAAEMRILGSITAVEAINENGTSEPVGLAVTALDIQTAKAPIMSDPTPDGEPETRNEIPTPDVDSVPEKKTEAADEDKVQKDLEQALSGVDDTGKEPAENETEASSYTRGQLEIVADQEGISGLREIGKGLDVKSNSIEDLIVKILGAQGSAQ